MSIAVQQQREKQSRLYAYIGTAIVHALIVLFLGWLGLMPPDEGLGGPSDIPVEEPAPPIPPQPEPEKQEDPVATQDIEDAPVVEEKKTEVKKKTEIVKPVEKKITQPVEQPRKVDERSLFKKKSNTSTSSGYGNGDAPGNEGRPDGDPNGTPGGNGQGGGTGNGIGNGTGNGIGDGTGDGVGQFELHGRSLARRPKVEDNSRETGKVVVQIVVDRTGKVIKATPGYKGSTTLHPSLLEKARQGALEAKFSAKPDGPEEQYGTITFIFKFKP
jgi:hypothetical protein